MPRAGGRPGRALRARDRAGVQRLLYFRVGYWLASAVARFLYRVRLGYADEAALAALAPDSTVVFVMNHRSNMDYVLVSFLAAERVALSYAVGEWARIWPLQALIRSMGAYFVRRNSGDPLYRRVLERYVQMATEAGVPQAMYPEGRPDARRPAARAQARPARLHAEGLRPARRARPRVHPGRDQLRPRARGPHAAAQARPAAPRRGVLVAARARRAALLARRSLAPDGCAAAGTASAMPASTSARRSRCARYLAERGIDLRAPRSEERFGTASGWARTLMAPIGA